MKQQRSKLPLTELLLGVGVFVVAFAGVWVSLEIRKPPEPPRLPVSLDTVATVLSEPMDLPPIQLADHRGQPFNNETLRGRWTFLFFGYTFCPDICPAALAVLAHARKILREEAGEIQPQVVLVSVDPERDTQARLGEYVAYFDREFLGVTGSDAALQKFTRPLGILYRKTPGASSDGNYLVDHSASILLVDPQARLRALTSPPHDGVAIADDFRKIVAKFG